MQEKADKANKVSKKSKEVNAELENLFKEEDSDYIQKRLESFVMLYFSTDFKLRNIVFTGLKNF